MHRIFLILLAGVVCLPLFGQVPQPTAPGSRTITTATPFLGVNNDPVGAGMGELAVVAAPRYYGSAAQMNPALFARGQETFGANLAYSPWLRALGIANINLYDLNGFFSTEQIGVGLNVRYFDFGQIQFTDGLGQPIGTGSPN
ncbi:MAG: hypothetical protein AAGM67_06610, partial [Bacteroidota bacterium]